MYNNNRLIKSFKPGSAILPWRALKFGSDDLTLVTATSAADLVIGFSNEIEVTADDVSKGNAFDAVLDGIAEAVSGAAITRGARLTIDSSGRVITAAPAAGANVQLVAIAMASAAGADEVIPVLIQRSVMQGA